MYFLKFCDTGFIQLKEKQIIKLSLSDFLLHSYLAFVDQHCTTRRLFLNLLLLIRLSFFLKKNLHLPHNILQYTFYSNNLLFRRQQGYLLFWLAQPYCTELPHFTKQVFYSKPISRFTTYSELKFNHPPLTLIRSSQHYDQQLIYLRGHIHSL